MIVKINFTIDREILYYTIMYMLLNRKTITKKAIIECIKENVQNKGESLINFPEYWGIDDNAFQKDIDINIIENLSNKYSSLIGY
jgi:hypothetical protein